MSLQTPVDYFYSEELKSIYGMLCGIFTVTIIIITPIHIYIILTQSKSLGNFKWLLLNYSIWNTVFELLVGVTRPVILYPAVAIYFLDPFEIITSLKMIFIAVNLILFAGILNCGGICMMLVFRYLTIFPGILSRLFTSKISLIFYIVLHIVVLFCLFYIGYLAKDLTGEWMRSQALNYSSSLAEFTNELSFVYIPKEMVYGTVLFIISISVVILIVLITLTIFLIREFIRLDDITSKTQKTLIFSCVIQVAISFGFLLIPNTILFIFLIYDIPHARVISEGITCVIVSHAPLEVFCAWYFVTPYRLFWKHLFKAILFKMTRKDNATLPSMPNATERVRLR